MCYAVHSSGRKGVIMGQITALFQQALDVVEKLPPEDQEMLVDLIRRRLVEWRRAGIAPNAAITLQAVREGRARYGSVEDLKRDLSEPPSVGEQGTTPGEPHMLRVRGVYDGTKVVLLDSLPIRPHTTVEMLIVKPTIDAEQVYWQRLIDLGLIREVRLQPTAEQPFEPVRVTGTPISQTILEERR